MDSVRFTHQRLDIQVSSNYRQGTGGRKSAPIIGSAVNQIFDFLTRARQKKSGQDTRASGSRDLSETSCDRSETSCESRVRSKYFRITRIALLVYKYCTGIILK